MNDEDQVFQKFAKETLDSDVDGLDAATLSRLRQARSHAIDKVSRPRTHWVPLTVAGTATAALLLVFVWQQQTGSNDIHLAMEEIELLASDADFELLDDMEFYQWLDTDGYKG